MVKGSTNVEWKPVIGYEGLYEISDSGLVKSCSKEWFNLGGKRNGIKKEHIMKGGKRCGYKTVLLFKNGVGTSFRVHKLVALHFIPNPQNKPCINHKNGIKTDNRVNNLEWCTVQENTIHSYKNGLQISKKRGEHSQAKKIKCDTLDLIFNCVNDAEEVLGIPRYSIGKVCNNRQRQSGGLVFRFI